MDAFKKKVLVVSVSSVLLAISSVAQAITLPQAVRQTVCSNPEIAIPIKRVLADHQKVAQARAGYFPKVDINAGFGREQSENSNTLSDPDNTITLWRREEGVTARQMLFDGFGTRSEVARNKALTDADAYQIWGTSEEVGLQAAEAYLNVLRTREIVAIAQRNLDAHGRTYSMIQKLSESGVGREADTDQALGRLSLARANLLAAQSQARDAVTTYLKVVGSEPVGLVAPPVPRPADLPQSQEAALALAVANHPILKSANADIREAQAQHDAAKSPFYPRVDFVASANHNRNLDGFRGPNNDLSGMVQLQYNIFRGGGDVARHNETAYQVQEAAEIRNRTYRQVAENMRLSWNALTISQSRLPALARHSRASQETVGAYRQQFQLGKRTLLDLLDSENEAFTSQTAYVNGRYDVIDAKYRVLNAEGKLLPYLRVSLPPQVTMRYDDK